MVFLEKELLYGVQGEVPDLDDYVLPIGKAHILRAGTDVTVVSHSRGLDSCLAAADSLAAQGVSCEIIDLRSLRPLDIETILASVQKTNRLVTVEEAWPVAGIGAEIAASVQARAFDALDAPIERVTGLDVPLPYAANLEAAALPTAERSLMPLTALVTGNAHDQCASKPDDPSAKPRVLASPLARRLAQDHQLDLAAIHGTGPNGRVIKRDILPILKREGYNNPNSASKHPA